MNDAFWKKWQLTIILSLIFFIAIFFWQLFLIEFLRGIFEAVAIAMVIVITVEQFLRREFAREVVFASIGYVLPKELQSEMRWLCELNMICTEDVMTCTLTTTGESVTFNVRRVQTVQNIGNRMHKVFPPIGLGIDQWFRDEGESRILKLSFVTEKDHWSYTGSVRRSKFGMDVPHVPDVSLEKEKTVTITSEFEEVYPRNGYFFMHIKYPTVGAKVIVNYPKDKLNVRVEFANRQNQNALRIGDLGDDYICPFTLLPYQRVAVGFRDKAKSDLWSPDAPPPIII